MYLSLDIATVYIFHNLDTHRVHYLTLISLISIPDHVH